MNILIICRQNIFRSVSAELLLKKYLKDNSIIGDVVVSRGTEASYEPMNTAVADALKGYGVDASMHKQMKLSKADIDSADAIVVMSKRQKEFMKEHYALDIPYYRMVCCNIDEPLLDVDETSGIHTLKEENDYISSTIRHIHDTIPDFYKNIQLYRK